MKISTFFLSFFFYFLFLLVHRVYANGGVMLNFTRLTIHNNDDDGDDDGLIILMENRERVSEIQMH